MRFNKPRTGQRGNYIFRSGHIVSAWNNWWRVWIVWYPGCVAGPKKIVVKTWKRWFAGFVDHKRGRHWDRKRGIS